MLSLYILLTATAGIALATTLPVHTIALDPDVKFENLAIRSNGQILVTTTLPNATIFQVDPLGILPTTLLHRFHNLTSSVGIVEKEPDIFYVATMSTQFIPKIVLDPSSYKIFEVNVRNVLVHPNGTLNRRPLIKHIATLPDAALPNGIAFARPQSDNLLVADSLRGLIWNVNTCDGSVSVALNDTTTKGPSTTGAAVTGVNGLKVYNGSLYWTNTGAFKLYKVPIDAHGNVLQGHSPVLIAENLSCDDFILDHQGNAYVAGPLDILTKVSPLGQKEIVAGTFNSTNSSLVAPTAVKFGRLVSDRWSIYITTNGGVLNPQSNTIGVYRIDLNSN